MEFTHSNRITSATGYSPFFVDHGYHPWTGKEPLTTSNNDRAEEFAKNMTKIRANAETALQKAADTMKKRYDHHCRPSQQYQPGQLVWLSGKNLRRTQGTDKLGPKRHGPFEVLKKVGQASYKLKLPPTWKIRPEFNERLLQPYNPPQFESQHVPPPPPPEIIEDEVEYDVEEVLDSRLRYRKLQYLVKWKGYPHEDNTWEPEGNLKNAKRAIADFHKKHPSAPRPAPQGLVFQPRINYTETTMAPEGWEDGKLPGKESQRQSQDGYEDATLGQGTCDGHRSRHCDKSDNERNNEQQVTTATNKAQPHPQPEHMATTPHKAQSPLAARSLLNTQTLLPSTSPLPVGVETRSELRPLTSPFTINTVAYTSCT